MQTPTGMSVHYFSVNYVIYVEWSTKPSLQYLLIDENNYTDSQLASLNNLVMAVFRLEHADSPSTDNLYLDN